MVVTRCDGRAMFSRVEKPFQFCPSWLAADGDGEELRRRCRRSASPPSRGNGGWKGAG